MGPVGIGVNWVTTITQLGFVVLAIIMASKLREKFPNEIDRHWGDAVIPSIAFLMAHLTVWWMWSEYWTPFFMSNGFMLLQIAGVFGIYAMSLSQKPARLLGKV